MFCVLVLRHWALFCNFIELSSCIQNEDNSSQYSMTKLEFYYKAGDLHHSTFFGFLHLLLVHSAFPCCMAVLSCMPMSTCHVHAAS
jgi:hypothetical protein